MALMYATIGEEQTAFNLIRYSIKEFQRYMNKYFVASMRMQAQQRLEAERKIVHFMNLCILAENWGVEDMRMELSECFFSVIRPYLEITYRQKKIMTLNDIYYEEEIERIDETILQIKEFAKHYEEELPEPM